MSQTRVHSGEPGLEGSTYWDAHVQTDIGGIHLTNVLYVPDLNINLFSTNQATDERARVTLDREGGQIHLADGIPLRMVKNRKRGLLEFRGETWKEHALIASPDLFMGVAENFASAEGKRTLTATELGMKDLATRVATRQGSSSSSLRTNETSS